MSDTPVIKGRKTIDFHVFDIKGVILQLGPAGLCKQTCKRRIKKKKISYKSCKCKYDFKIERKALR